MNLKLQEGLLALLHIDKRFAPALFDFNEPACHFVGYDGRRYHGVYERELVDVYAEVGFKNPSHFSTAFKKQYGILILL